MEARLLIKSWVCLCASSSEINSVDFHLQTFHSAAKETGAPSPCVFVCQSEIIQKSTANFQHSFAYYVRTLAGLHWPSDRKGPPEGCRAAVYLLRWTCLQHLKPLCVQPAQITASRSFKMKPSLFIIPPVGSVLFKWELSRAAMMMHSPG